MNRALFLVFLGGCVELPALPALPALPDFGALAPDEDLAAARELVAADLAVLRSLELFETDGMLVTEAMRHDLCADLDCEHARIERFVAQASRLHDLTRTAVEVSDDILLQCSVYVEHPFERSELALDALASLQIVHVGPQVESETVLLHTQQAILCGLAEQARGL